MDIQLGRSRTVRRAYGIDEIALVPGGRTVDPDVTDSSWSLGGISRDIPIIASAMDGVVDVGMAVELSRLGALGVLNLEGVQCRYDDPNPILDRIAAVGKEEFVPLMQELYSAPVREDLIRSRIAEIKAQGGIAAVTRPEDSFASHIEDTLKAGAGLCDPAAVALLVHQAPACVERLLQLEPVCEAEAAGAAPVTSAAAGSGDDGQCGPHRSAHAV